MTTKSGLARSYDHVEKFQAPILKVYKKYFLVICSVLKSFTTPASRTPYSSHSQKLGYPVLKVGPSKYGTPRTQNFSYFVLSVMVVLREMARPRNNFHILGVQVRFSPKSMHLAVRLIIGTLFTPYYQFNMVKVGPKDTDPFNRSGVQQWVGSEIKLEISKSAQKVLSTSPYERAGKSTLTH